MKIYSTVKGQVMSESNNTFKKDGKDEVKRFINLFQDGNDQLIKIAVDEDTQHEVGQTETIDVVISDYIFNGRFGVSVREVA